MRIKAMLDTINDKMEQLLVKSEQQKIREYIAYQKNPKDVFKMNFKAGLYRGFGMAVGFTILGAIVLMVLQQLAQDNIPGIGKFISDLMDTIESYR